MKKTKLGYNGWSNYETWLVSVHDYIPALIDIVYNDSMFTREIKKGDYDINDYLVDADWCEEEFESMVSDDIPNRGIIADMVNASIQEIDFREIADQVNEVIEEEVDSLNKTGSGRR